MSNIQSNLQNLYFKSPYWIRYTVGKVMNKLPKKYTYGNEYARYIKFLKISNKWSLEEYEKYQFEQLKNLIEYSWKYVPFYQKLWTKHGFSPNQFNNINDISKIPFIDKDLIMVNKANFISTNKEMMNKVDLGSTGGTSGTQFEFYINKNRLGIEQAFRTDQWKRLGFTQGANRAVFRGCIDKNSAKKIMVHEPILNEYRFNVFRMKPSTMKKYVNILSIIKVPFIYGYPSAIEYLARFYISNNISPPKNLKGVILLSEKPYPEQINTIKQAFVVRVSSYYGMSEKVTMGAECENSQFYHYYPQYGFTEFIKKNGKIAEIEDKCEIVGTSFMNTIIPFIRYKTGDYTIFKGNHCDACDRNHPLSSEVESRWGKDILIGKERGLFTNTALNMHTGTMKNVERYQYYQDTIGKATLLIVKGPNYTKNDQIRILNAYKTKGDKDLEFKIKYVEKLIQTTIGKIPIVIQKLSKSEMV